MAATVRDSIATFDDRVNTTVAITMPTNRPDGDLMMMWVLVRASQTISTGPSGWTLATGFPFDSGGASSANDCRVYLYTKGASGEPSSYNVVVSATTIVVASVLSVRDARMTLGTAASTLVAAGTASSTSVDAPTVTPTIPDGLLLTFHGYRNGFTWTQPAGMTQVIDSGETNTAIGNSSIVSSLALSSVSATGVKTATRSTGNNTNGRLGVSIVVASAIPRRALVVNQAVNRSNTY